MESIISKVPVNLLNFLLVTLFSLLIGLSLRILHPDREENTLFGTDRTFTFIGILGYILYIISPEGPYIFIVGGIVLSVFLAINYLFKITYFRNFGLTTIVVALITYCQAPLLFTQPFWLFLLIIVTVLVFTEMKASFMLISKRIDKNEFITLAKFLAIAGVILPIVPDKQILPYISLTAYKLWLGVVVISSISYLSYLLNKFVYKKSGVIITGILGGLYSSTAATIILSRKSKEFTDANNQYSSSIIFATAIMYLRILVLIFIFNNTVFLFVYPYFIVLIIVSILTGSFILYYKKNEKNVETEIYNDKNPLEFRVALIFTILYIAFNLITQYTINNYGIKGLNFLSLLTGFTDIDPFLINLFQGKFVITTSIIASATLLAIISNNVLKLIYALTLSGKGVKKLVLIGFIIIIVTNISILFLI